MSGRIETINSHKEESANKYSKNETFSIKRSGVDIGEDIDISSSSGKSLTKIVSRSASTPNISISTSYEVIGG